MAKFTGLSAQWRDVEDEAKSDGCLTVVNVLKDALPEDENEDSEEIVVEIMEQDKIWLQEVVEDLGLLSINEVKD